MPATQGPLGVQPAVCIGGALRVGFVLWSGGIGGAEIWTVSLVKALRTRGVSATVLFVGHGEPLFSRLEMAGIPAFTLGLDRGVSVFRDARGFAALAAEAGHDLLVLPSSGFLGIALRLGRYPGKTLAIEHGALLEVDRLPSRKRLWRLLIETSGAWTLEAQMAPSQYVAGKLGRVAHSKRIIHVPLGLEIEEYRPLSGNLVSGEQRRLTIGFAGRLIPGKGLDVLLAAIARMSDFNAPALLVAGDGPERANLERIAKQCGAAGRVTFLGMVMDMPSFWRQCDIAVVPSNEIVESFGLVAVEAMACGLPVIASARGGLAEIVVDGVTGILVPAGDPKAICDAVASYCNDPGLRTRHGRAARLRVEAEYDINVCAQRIEAIAHELLGTGVNRQL